MKFFQAVGVAVAATAVLAAAPARADDRPLTLVVGYPAGGATDILARLLQTPLSRELKRTVIVKNVAGAAGTIGASEVAKATPDGTTVLLTPIGPVAFLPYLRKVPYDRGSFIPVCRVVDAPVVMMTAPGRGLKTYADVVQAAKADPGGIPYASTGEGTLPHLSQLAWAKSVGVTVLHVPFKGSGEVVTALKSGTVRLFNDQMSVAAQYDLTPLVIFTDRRLARFPDVPTAKELGSELSFSIWSGLYVPAGTRPQLVAQLESACRTVLSDREVQERLQKVGQTAEFLNSKAFQELNTRDAARMERVILESGLKVTQ